MVWRHERKRIDQSFLIRPAPPSHCRGNFVPRLRALGKGGPTGESRLASLAACRAGIARRAARVRTAARGRNDLAAGGKRGNPAAARRAGDCRPLPPWDHQAGQHRTGGAREFDAAWGARRQRSNLSVRSVRHPSPGDASGGDSSAIMPCGFVRTRGRSLHCQRRRLPSGSACFWSCNSTPPTGGGWILRFNLTTGPTPPAAVAMRGTATASSSVRMRPARGVPAIPPLCWIRDPWPFASIAAWGSKVWRSESANAVAHAIGQFDPRRRRPVTLRS